MCPDRLTVSSSEGFSSAPCCSYFRLYTDLERVCVCVHVCACMRVCVCIIGVRRLYWTGNPFSNSQCWSAVTLIDSQPGISQPVRQLIQDQSDCLLRVLIVGLERAVELNMLDSDTVSCLQNTNSHHRLISDCRLLASALRPVRYQHQVCPLHQTHAASVSQLICRTTAISSDEDQPALI